MTAATEILSQRDAALEDIRKQRSLRLRVALSHLKMAADHMKYLDAHERADAIAAERERCRLWGEQHMGDVTCSTKT